MSSLQQVDTLTRAGRYGDALHVFLTLVGDLTRDVGLEVLHAHLLERTGHYEESRTLCERTLSRALASKLHRSILETTLGIIHNDCGRPHLALEHFQRACSLAEAVGDLSQVCWSKLRLMLAVADSAGPDAALPLLAQVKAGSQRLGDLQVTAALHLFLAEMETKRGLLQNARKHVSLGRRLLLQEPNYWLDARAENVLVAISIMQSDVSSGLAHGMRALQLSEASGSGSLRRACLGNLGNVHFLLGEFEKAIDYYTQAEHALFKAGFCSNASLDSLAQIRIREGDFAAAASCIRTIEGTIVSESDWQLHPNRYAQLTRAELLLREGRIREALAACDKALILSERSGDHFLKGSALLLKAHVLLESDNQSESARILEGIDRRFLRFWPELDAKYEAAIGRALVRSGNRTDGVRHYERAQRMFQGLGNVPGASEVVRLATDALGSHGLEGSKTIFSPSSSVVQNLAALMSHVGRPELVAIGLVAVLKDTGCVDSAKALIHKSDGTESVLASYVSPNETPARDIHETVIELGAIHERFVQVRWQSRGDLESIATLTAVSRLLDTAHDLQRAQIERQEQQTIWPLAETTTDPVDAFVGEKMRELMAFAKRIAATNIGVLITGESGTGKEVLARTIHAFSGRAEKPFVPFNCTAVPREMLESQLFGHRRGAFTSADRDSLGLIRAARSGTLFLDEVGELSLELQPKLLRFFESGEIQPLGETSPISVDVRIIAATNANLEELVKNGRFREDLYYRLNIIRLIIPPLRERRDEIPSLVHNFVNRAASEFKKRRVGIAQETMEHLLLYSWPGNVRQLQNEVRRMVALAEADSILTPSALSDTVLRGEMPPNRQHGSSHEISIGPHEKLTPTLWKIEREMIRVALTSHKGKVEDAAKSLGISRKGLYLKRRRLGI